MYTTVMIIWIYLCVIAVLIGIFWIYHRLRSRKMFCRVCMQTRNFDYLGPQIRRNMMGSIVSDHVYQCSVCGEVIVERS